MLDPSAPNERRLFRTGERGAFGDDSGVIVAAFPDGFHLIRVDDTGQISGAHASQMTSIEQQRDKSGGRSRISEQRDDMAGGGAQPGGVTKNQ